MRVPPYYRDPKWQRFFAGTFIGMVVSWGVFLFIFGQMQDEQILTLSEQRNKITQLNQEIQMWKEDVEHLNNENKKKLIVEDIVIELTNAKELKLDLLTVQLLKDAIQGELQPLLKQNIATIVENKNFLFKTIENKIYDFDQSQYTVKVKYLFLSTTLEVHVEVQLRK
ncbi:sporulation membrane protein YtrI [Bacillus solimangrovi]|uniref:Sporulation membrane protein YtrI C-terminal domain-containing protein n=1 Tax=Bacillus solimangrovi TaxID=1305675 RepID=A0A1E5LCT9_9BACI|nr:sporulation membrane protein YtrI [Bacillus solimangrovi]OEH91849.1 hypothetical protein BFG57_03685 [Bacillus solimangrovi]